MATPTYFNAVPLAGQGAETIARSPRTSGPRIRFSGVLVIALVSTALALATASECHSIFYPPSLMYGAVLWGWWGIVATALWKLGPRRPSLLRVSPGSLAFQLVLACVLGVAHLVSLGSLEFTASTWRAHYTAMGALTHLLNTNRFGLEILIYGFIFAITGISQYQIRAQRDAMKALELEKQLSAAHLRALQMQLEPHFLFNTLNAITTLVELGRQQEAAGMLAHLNTILKSTLSRTTPEKVPLSQELEIVENYLAIEQVRFADRLRIELKVDPSALDSLVPCFLLQPIVENAIRHGIAHCENEGLVEASARREGQLLHLRIRDTGRAFQEFQQGRQKQKGHGIGLRNTRERLMHFYQDAYQMQAEPLDAGGFEVSITIPYERR